MEEFEFLHHLCIINSNSTEKIIIFSAFFYPKSGKNQRISIQISWIELKKSVTIINKMLKKYKISTQPLTVLTNGAIT